MSESEILKGLLATATGANYLTIRGDSELGKFLNEALSQSLGSFQDVSSQSDTSSVTNLQIALQSPKSTSLSQSRRSCSKINFDLPEEEEGDSQSRQSAADKAGQKWKSCAAGLNGFQPPSPRNLGPTSPSPYIPFAETNLRESSDETCFNSLSFKESNPPVSTLAGQYQSQKSQSQNEISASHVPSQPLMSASCVNVSELQKCGHESGNSYMFSSYSGSSEKADKTPNWRRTSVSKWIEAWEKYNNNDTQDKTDLDEDASKLLSLGQSEVTQKSDVIGLPAILSSSSSRSASCLVEAILRNPIENTIDSEFVERLQATVDSLQIDSDTDDVEVIRQVKGFLFVRRC